MNRRGFLKACFGGVAAESLFLIDWGKPSRSVRSIRNIRPPRSRDLYGKGPTLELDRDLEAMRRYMNDCMCYGTGAIEVDRFGGLTAHSVFWDNREMRLT